MPNPASFTVATTGTHAVLIVGYDDRTRHFLVRNSWGRDWVRRKKKQQKSNSKSFLFFLFLGYWWIFLYSI
jgi:uncharacterized protein YvpB